MMTEHQTDTRIASSSLRHVPRVAGAVGVMVGLLVLFGWMFDIAALKSIHPALATMKVNTAIAFLLAGVSLWLLRLPPRQRTAEKNGQAFRTTVARAGAFAVATIGLLTFSQYLFGWDLRIDQLLFREPPGAVGTSHLGRMAPNAALNFLFIGVALLLLDASNRRARQVSQILTLLALLISVQALVNYAYGITSFYGIASYVLMALHTALMFAVLCVGILCARPERGVMAIITSDAGGGLFARRLLLISFFVPLVLGLSLIHI